MPTTASLTGAVSAPIGGRNISSRNGIPWPRLETGRLDLSDAHSAKWRAPIPRSHQCASCAVHYLKCALPIWLSVTTAGIERSSPRSVHAPGAINRAIPNIIFGPSVWLRGLIKPPPGHAVAYIDWSQQEFGIAAALSGDEAMMAAYRSGDPYLAFAKQAGAVPQDATKKTHGPTRESCSSSVRWVCCLGWGLKGSPCALGSR